MIRRARSLLNGTELSCAQGQHGMSLRFLFAEILNKKGCDRVACAMADPSIYQPGARTLKDLLNHLRAYTAFGKWLPGSIVRLFYDPSSQTPYSWYASSYKRKRERLLLFAMCKMSSIIFATCIISYTILYHLKKIHANKTNLRIVDAPSSEGRSSVLERDD